MRTTHPLVLYRCESCGERFETPEELLWHDRHEHGTASLRAPISRR